jgi:hypothetical protein
MKKKFLLFVIAMLLSVASIFAQGGTTGPLTWNINNGTLTISGEGEMPDYDWYDDPAPWFPYELSITTVVIENGVTSIGNFAFSYNRFTSISISNSVKSIGHGAFYYCSYLISITIPNGVTSIGEGAFAECTYLNSVSLSSSVSSIGNYAFQGCRYITSITIPNGVASIGELVFSFCSNLSSINVGNENTHYSSDDGVLFNKNKTTLICCPGGRTGNYVIPNSVTDIGDFAFWACFKLISITIPNNVISIGNDAFTDCRSLSSINIPSSITSIGHNAFSDCRSLSSIDIPSSVTSIGAGTFANCISLTSITVPNSITSIGLGAFMSCLVLNSITIPEGVSRLEHYVFAGCESLTSIIIPNGVKSIGAWAFASCSALTSITIPAGVGCIEHGTFWYCSSLTSIVLPSPINDIGSWAFSNCTSLTSITNLRIMPVILHPDVFEYMDKSACTLKVPTSAVSRYQNANEWKGFNVIGGGFLVDAFAIREFGYVTGNGLYEVNDTATVTATARSGYKFVNWTKDGVEVSTNNLYSFIVTEDVELFANFEEKTAIEPIEKEKSNIFVYPNPTSGELFVETHGCVSLQNVEIFDVFGKKVFEQKATTPNPSKGEEFPTVLRSYDLTVFPTGIYFIRITPETGVITRKIIKQ